MARFTERPREVTAVQFTGLSSVKTFENEFRPYAIVYESAGAEKTLKITIRQNGETLTINKHDHLVREGNKIQIMSDFYFCQMYQLAQDEDE